MSLTSGPGWRHSADDHPNHWSTRCDWHPLFHVFDHDPTTAEIITADRACENAIVDAGAFLAPSRYGDLRQVLHQPAPWRSRYDRSEPPAP